MKRTTSLLLCLVLSISLFAQSRGVTFQVHNETLTSVLKKIEKAGEKNILFAYQATDQYRVTANIQAKRQKEALEMVLQGKPFSFVEHNTYFAVQYTGKTQYKGSRSFHHFSCFYDSTLFIIQHPPGIGYAYFQNNVAKVQK